MSDQIPKKLSFVWIVIFLILFSGVFFSGVFPGFHFENSNAFAAPETDASPAGHGEDQSGFYYTIQKGDTLWSLSKKFYNSQWDWPGLWEMNKDIKNPHWIYPGKKIRIFLKSDPKRTELSETVPDPISTPDPVIPTFVYLPMNKVGFIRDTKEKSLGSIIREQNGHLMMTTNDIIFIDPTSPDALVPGTLYHIFDTTPVNETFGAETFTGYQHQLKAEVKILENHGTYAVGKITSSFRDVAIDDKLMPLVQRPKELPIRNDPPPIDGVLVCSEDNTVMINDHRIAFINRGSADGIRPGDIYSIAQSQTNTSFFGIDEGVRLPPLFAGRLIVLHTEDYNSTIVVISSKRAIHPGDMVDSTWEPYL